MLRPRAAASAKAARRRCFAAFFAFGVVALCASCNPTFNWREFRSPDDFVILLPGRPQTVSREIKLPDGAVQMSMTSTGIGATLFAVGAAPLPPGLSSEPSARERTVEHLRDALVRNVNGSVTRSSAATLPASASGTRNVLAGEAIEAAGRDSGGRAVQLAARLYVVDGRLYQLVALGAEGEISADMLDTFFTSFRLL